MPRADGHSGDSFQACSSQAPQEHAFIPWWARGHLAAACLGVWLQALLDPATWRNGDAFGCQSSVQAVFGTLDFLPPLVQGDTPKHRAEKANDPDLAAYLENRQHYQMIQREDQETAV